ncbi:MAG: DNA-processing protein DprA [Intestinibacillus sp.]
MSARLHWLWLATRAPLRPHQTAALLAHFGSAEQVYAADRCALTCVSGLTRAQVDALCDKELHGAERISDACQRLGAGILTLADTAYPDRLRQIADPPAVLYVRGTLPDLDAAPGIAVVGTRRASAYGRAAAENMARKLTEAGFIIVSGMASGIDGEANRAALRAGGRTVAVLGCGVDVCYPPHHKALMGDILLAGAVVSEYPPGTEPLAAHFPARNRIISGLCVGTLVIEAPLRSGSLITARCALDQGRDVFAVPGNIGVPSFDGSNRMIADGEAMLAAAPRDIIREYAGLLPEISKESRVQRVLERQTGEPPRANPGLWQGLRERARRERPTPEPAAAVREAAEKPALPAHLTDEERAIVQAVQRGADTTDAIIDAVGLPTQRVTASITMLELDGVLTREGGRLRAAITIRRNT